MKLALQIVSRESAKDENKEDVTIATIRCYMTQEQDAAVTASKVNDHTLFVEFEE